MYYAENPDAAHDIHELRVELLGENMTFLTDAGVFSKKMVDFGSQLLLKCLEVNKGETVLDVGCGYGPLGLSLVKAYGVQATMVDINNRALDLARQNAERNKVEATIFQSNIYECAPHRSRSCRSSQEPARSGRGPAPYPATVRNRRTWPRAAPPRR